MEIKDSVVVVTGASAGIGRAAAQRFAAAGARLVLAARSADRLDALAAELQGQGHEAIAVPTDMRDQEQVIRLIDAAVERFGRLDILINNAGQSVAGAVADVNPDHMRQIIELNVFGPLYAMQAAIPHMRRSGGGLIINVSSMVSKMTIPGLSGYAATKSALNMLSATARGELAGDNIRVITMYPRTTATDFGAHALGDQALRSRQRANAQHVQVDSAEQVAEKILEAARTEPAEQYMDR
jgi:short-subunit dehydrogenase